MPRQIIAVTMPRNARAALPKLTAVAMVTSASGSTSRLSRAMLVMPAAITNVHGSAAAQIHTMPDRPASRLAAISASE